MSEPADSKDPASEFDILRAENARLRRLLEDPESFVAERTPDGGLRVEVKHWAVRLLAVSLADSLGDSPNFLTGELRHPEPGRGLIEFTIRRTFGKTPAQALSELRARLDAVLDWAARGRPDREAARAEVLRDALEAAGLPPPGPGEGGR